jgi:hypothetical protein
MKARRDRFGCRRRTHAQFNHYATLARTDTIPSRKFAIRANAIEIHPDYSRELTVVDPDHRELWISLGCALENLLLAARATGYAAEVTYPDSADVIRVNLISDTPQPNPLFDAIPERQNTRSEYDGRPIPASDLDRILSLPPLSRASACALSPRPTNSKPSWNMSIRAT